MFDLAGEFMALNETTATGEFYGRGLEYYHGILRILVVLHHDFPDFLVENHARIVSRIPDHCIQASNLVLSAIPSTCPEFPAPFNTNLERLAETRVPVPVKRGYTDQLKAAKLLDQVDELLGASELRAVDVQRLAEAITMSVPKPTKPTLPLVTHHTTILNSLVLHVADTHLINNPTGPVYDPTSTAAQLLPALLSKLPATTQLLLLKAMVNNLRYPNDHTTFYLHVVLGLVHIPPSSENAESELITIEMLVRVLLERLIVQRPHPWGVLVALLEMYKLKGFWDLPFAQGEGGLLLRSVVDG